MVFARGVKVYPLHEDTFGFYPDPVAPKEAIEAIWEQDLKTPMESLGENPLRKSVRPRLFHYQYNSFNDPICVFFFLDLLVKWQRGAYIRPHYMVPVLRTEQPQIHWSISTVGRMLGGLAAVCADDYFAVVDPFVDDIRHVPFAKGRDARGAYYVVDPQGGDEGLLWLVRARDIFLGLAEAVMLREEKGIFEDSFAKMPKPADYFAQHLDHTIRTKEGFLAQLRPDQRFQMAPRVARWSGDPFEGAVAAVSGA